MAPRNASSPALPASPCARVPGCSLPRLGASQLPPPDCRPPLCLFAFGREVVPRESAVACEGPGSRGFEGESQAGRLNFPWNPEKTPEGPLGSAASLPLVPPAPPASLPDPQTCRSPASPHRRLLGWGADTLCSRHPSRFYSHAAGGGCPLLSPPLLSQDSRCRAVPHVNRVCLDQHPHSPALPPALGLQRCREPARNLSTLTPLCPLRPHERRPNTLPKFPAPPGLSLREDTREVGSSSGTCFLMSCLWPPHLPAAGRLVLAEEISPAESTGESPSVPKPEVTPRRKPALRSGPQAKRTKRGTHSSQELLALCPLLSSVTVKRHRGCDCHLCRQSVRLHKANQSQRRARLIYQQHLPLQPPPAPPTHPHHPGREGWEEQSRTWETAEPAGAEGKRPRERATVCGPDSADSPGDSGASERPQASRLVPGVMTGWPGLEKPGRLAP